MTLSSLIDDIISHYDLKWTVQYQACAESKMCFAAFGIRFVECRTQSADGQQHHFRRRPCVATTQPRLLEVFDDPLELGEV